MDVGDSENEAFLTEFRRDLEERGRRGALLVNLRRAGPQGRQPAWFQTSAWQRGRVHGMRNLRSVACQQRRSVIAA